MRLTKVWDPCIVRDLSECSIGAPGYTPIVPCQLKLKWRDDQHSPIGRDTLTGQRAIVEQPVCHLPIANSTLQGDRLIEPHFLTFRMLRKVNDHCRSAIIWLTVSSYSIKVLISHLWVTHSLEPPDPSDPGRASSSFSTWHVEQHNSFIICKPSKTFNCHTCTVSSLDIVKFQLEVQNTMTDTCLVCNRINLHTPYLL